MGNEVSGWQSDVEDDYCCALLDGHEGCCAYRCGTCQGAGDCGCETDDVVTGCDLCDYTGSCLECAGTGWFNEIGESIPTVSPLEQWATGECDWGDCNAEAERWRFDEEHGWLPVCARHAESDR